MRELPAGTVTFLFTDVEGSTKLLHELGAAAYAGALGGHRHVLREAFGTHGGVEVDTQGDAFFVAFPTASGALQAAADARDGLASGPIRVRIGIHTGSPHLAEEGYVGVDVHRTARIAACGHGGQVLVSAATAALVDKTGLRDLGEHRLKDLSAPERIYQLGNGDFPPLKSLHQTNLPIPATPFLGRDEELAAVTTAIGESRLVTLTGPGGTGKTRLAIQAAAEVADASPDGVWWVSLTPVRDAALVRSAIAQVLQAKGELEEQIGDKRFLLVLDNFEQVIDAATDLAALHGACPNLRIVVTSREVLQLAGEQAYAVPPLKPDDATQLFIARALSARADFQPGPAVAEICARLEHLPLAVELAAARVRVLSPELLLDRLAQRLDLLKGGRDADPRHQTLRATIQWSYDLLSPTEKKLFARLSVFAGGHPLEAAEEVCEADLDTLASLVEKSLVRQSASRFWMLETIREFAAERLEASGEGSETRLRHAAFFTAFAVESDPKLRTREQIQWMTRFQQERNNIRAALEFLGAQPGGAEEEARLAGACTYFWILAADPREGRMRLEAALRRAVDIPPDLKAGLRSGLAQLAFIAGDGESAVRHAEEGLRIRRELADDRGLLRPLLARALAATLADDVPATNSLLQECADLARRVGDRWFLGLCLQNLGCMAFEARDFARSRLLFAEGLEQLEEVGDPQSLANGAANLASAELELGEHERAAARFRSVIESTRDGRFPEPVIWCLDGLAAAEIRVGDAERAAMLFGASEGIAERIGYALPTMERKRHADTLELLRERIGDGIVAARTAGSALDLAQGIELALEGTRG
jgi:predicted ATPase